MQRNIIEMVNIEGNAWWLDHLVQTNWTGTKERNEAEQQLCALNTKYFEMLEQGTCGSVPEIELDEDLDKLVSYHMTRFAQPFKRFCSLKRHVDNLQLLSDAAREITPDEGYRYDIIRNGADVLIKLLEDPDFTFEIFDPVVHDVLRILYFQVDGTSNRYSRKQKLAVVLALARADHRYKRQLDPFLEVIDWRTKRREQHNYKSKDLLLSQSRIEFLREGAVNNLPTEYRTYKCGKCGKHLYGVSFYKAQLRDDGECWTCVNESKFLDVSEGWNNYEYQRGGYEALNEFISCVQGPSLTKRVRKFFDKVTVDTKSGRDSDSQIEFEESGWSADVPQVDDAVDEEREEWSDADSFEIYPSG
jgi:hypothetical protein